MSMTAGSVTITIGAHGANNEVYTAGGTGMALAVADALIAAGLPIPVSAQQDACTFWSNFCNGLASGLVTYLTTNAQAIVPIGSIDGTHPTSQVLLAIE
jgi:hypothetical protein